MPATLSSPLPGLFPILTLLVGLVLPGRASEGHRLSLSTDFPGGSAEIVSVDAESGAIHLRPALREGRGWPCWWYLRVDGAAPGKPIDLTVSGHPGPFRPGGAALAASWAQPRRAALSDNDRDWRQTPEASLDAAARTATYRFEAPAARFWVAWGPPFLPAQAEALLAATAAAHPGAERFRLATSRGGRPVPGIRIGRPDAPAAIWVQARQHAWEAGSSWVGQGFLEWMAGDDPAAKALRETTAIHFVPIMDVDNVAMGAGGKEAVPRDHNRDWSGEPVYPEVAAAQARIGALDREGRLRLFIDLHNPGPGDKQSFFFGPFDFETMAAPVRSRYQRWIALAEAEIQGPPSLQPGYRFATYVKTDEERARMSSGWVRLRTDPARVVSVTLETAWNTPANTAGDYRRTGGQLGRTVARFLASAGAPASSEAR